MKPRPTAASIGRTAWAIARPILSLGFVLWACFALSSALHAQDEAFWDSPFSVPLYVVRIKETATMYGLLPKNVYILYPVQPNADGTLLTADGSGGHFINKAELHSGAHTTPRQVCNAVKGLDPSLLDLGFNCVILYATEDCGAWCSLQFAHGTSDGTGDYPNCSCICVKGYEYLERGGDYMCVPCDTLCPERDPQLRYDAPNSTPNSCSCVCQDGYRGSDDTGCAKVDCGSHAFNIVDQPGALTGSVCPPERRLNRHCCCDEGAVPWGGICQREVELPPDRIQWRTLSPQNVIDVKVLTTTLQAKGYRRIAVTPEEYAKTTYPAGTATFWGVDGTNVDGKPVHSVFAHSTIVANPQGDQMEMGAAQVNVFPAKAKPSAPMAPKIASGTYFPHEVWVPPEGARIKPSLGRLVGMPRGTTDRGPGRIATSDWTCHGFVKGVAEAYVAVPDMMEPLPDEIETRDANVVPMKDPPGVPFALELHSGALYGRESVLDLFLPDGYVELEGEFTVEVDTAGDAQVRVMQGQATYYPGIGSGEAIPVYGEQSLSVRAGTPGAAQPFAPERLERWWAKRGGALDLPEHIAVQTAWGEVKVSRLGAIAGAGACALSLCVVVGGAVLAWRAARRRRPERPPAAEVRPLPVGPERGRAPALRSAGAQGIPVPPSPTPPVQLPGLSATGFPSAAVIWGRLVPAGGSSAPMMDLARALVTIGRAPSNDIVLADDQVSQQHAQIQRQGGSAAIRDLQSTNGTYLNGQRIAGVRPLAPGDRIRLGRTEWVIEAPRAPARRDSATAHLAVARGRATPSALNLGDEADVTIGREGDNDMVIHDDPRISRHHAQLTGTPAGHEIVDLGSTNGIAVNGVRVSRATLRDGDLVRLGGTELVYRRAEEG